MHDEFIMNYTYIYIIIYIVIKIIKYIGFNNNVIKKIGNKKS